MVIPAGERYQQTLYLMRKKDGKLEKEALRPTLFVPMTGTAEGLRRIKPDPANPRAANGNATRRVPTANSNTGPPPANDARQSTVGSRTSGANIPATVRSYVRATSPTAMLVLAPRS